MPVPELGVSRPHSMRMVVVLPAPLLPSRPKTSPGATSKLTSSTDVKAPKRLNRCSTRMTAGGSRRE